MMRQLWPRRSPRGDLQGKGRFSEGNGGRSLPGERDQGDNW